ncbi:hypothetical protein GYM41_002402 [Escherichia coli]|nr:hypothetical protein [Escherichia coli]
MQAINRESPYKFANKLLIGLLACMLYRIITITITTIYTYITVPHKVHTSTNIYIFFSFLFISLIFFIVTFTSSKKLAIIIATLSTLLLGVETFNAGLPYRALSMMLSAMLSYYFIFLCNFKEKENSKHENVLKVACAILYVFYLFYEHIFFRNFSLIVFFFVILTFFISWLNIKLN